MKRISFIAAALMACSLAFAGPVTQDEAQKRAAQFMASRLKGTTAASMKLAKRQPRNQSAIGQAETGNAASYYVFNKDADGGFVIVSGDDRTPTILGYSDRGHFDPDNIPENMAAWLKGCEEQIANLSTSAESAANATNTGATTLDSHGAPIKKAPVVRNSVAPLLTTAWGQTDPYNRMVLDPNRYSDICFTGCVATAMAQLLNYHAQLTGKPQATAKEIEAYITKTHHYRVDGALKGTVLDWENMLDAYYFGTTKESEEQKEQINAVAQLMHICGASVKMDYDSEDGSAADNYVVPDALKDYFGYDSGTRVVRRKDFTILQWNNIIYKELTEHRPVFYFGLSSSKGHAFLVDGFDGDEMYHINWGWDGHCDGYYLLTLANPPDKQGAGAGNSVDGYSMSQGAVIGIQPDTGVPFVEKNIQLTFKEIVLDGSNITFSAYNYNETTAMFQYGLGLFGEDGSITPLYTFATENSLDKFWGIRDVINIVSLPKMDGTVFKLALISKQDGAEEWLTQMNTEEYYIEAVGNDNKVTLSINIPVPALKVESINYESPTLAKRINKVDVNVSNSGKGFYGNLYFITKQKGYALSDTLALGATILKGQSQTLQFQFKPVYAGEYYVKIAADEDMGGVFFNDTIEVEEGAPMSNDVELSVDIKIANLNKTGKSILGSKAQMVVTVKNDTDTDFEGDFILIMHDASKRNIEYYDNIRHFNAHSETVIEEEFGVSRGKKYLPLVLEEQGDAIAQITQKPRINYDVVPAVTIYKADGTHKAIDADIEIEVPEDAVAVDLFENSTTSTVTPSSNPNCLYYLSDGATKPEGLTNNVVIGSKAESLVISDQGLPFMPIAAFNADTVMYSRLFTEGVKAITDSMGTAVKPSWTTICLPFEVDRCIVDGEVAVDWMRNEEDSIYNFWLMEYQGDERNILFFAPTDTMKAYTPYMIAVPAAGLKGLRDMTANPVLFCGRNAAITTSTRGIAASTNYKFVGSMENINETGWVYNIAPDGTGYQRDNVNIPPFRAYMKAMSNSVHTTYVPISMGATLNVEAIIDQWLKGDVNSDGKVNVADISAVITLMTGVIVDEWVLPADVNGDGHINVADIAAIIIIMAE